MRISKGKKHFICDISLEWTLMFPLFGYFILMAHWQTTTVIQKRQREK